MENRTVSELVRIAHNNATHSTTLMRLTDKALTTISLTVSATGLLILLIITSLPPTDLTAAFSTPTSTPLSLKATIEDAQLRGSTTSLTLRGNCTLPALAFDTINITPGTPVKVSGQVKQEQGERTLYITRITPDNNI
jgi:hypothetical protein